MYAKQKDENFYLTTDFSQRRGGTELVVADFHNGKYTGRGYYFRRNGDISVVHDERLKYILTDPAKR